MKEIENTGDILEIIKKFYLNDQSSSNFTKNKSFNFGSYSFKFWLSRVMSDFGARVYGISKRVVLCPVEVSDIYKLSKNYYFDIRILEI